MTERPIIFNGPMMRAILEGRKTQTRRVLKPQPDRIKDWAYRDRDGWGFRGMVVAEGAQIMAWDVQHATSYQPSDLLWIREAWSKCTGCNPPPGVIYRADGVTSAHRWRPSIHMPRWASRLTLRVMDVRVQRVQEISEEDAQAEGVECEVYDDRKPMSACWWDYNSGCWSGAFPDGAEARGSYRTLWDSIHAKHPERQWAANPWVVALTFERVTNDG